MTYGYDDLYRLTSETVASDLPGGRSLFQIHLVLKHERSV
jgi:hypothetical protein